MEVILLEKIRNLGNMGDLIKVAPGYGRNYLIPQKKAVPATDANIHDFKLRKAELEQKAADVLALAQQRAAALNALTVNIEARASDEGKLYGSVSTGEIAAAIMEAGQEVEKREILLPEGKPIHDTGEYEIHIQLHSDVSASVKVNVQAAE